MARALRRVGVLTGLAAAGWLLGQSGAVADDLPGPGLAPVAEVASEASDAAESAEAGADIRGAVPEANGHDAQGSPEIVGDALADTGERGRAAVETGVPALASVAEAGGVADAADAAGSGAREVVETTARGTGKVVSGTVDAGREVGGFADESLGESELTGAVSDRLTGGTGRIQEHLEQTIEEGPRAGIDGVTGALAPPRPHNGDAGADTDRRDSRASGDSAPDESAEDPAAASARPAQQAPAATGAVAATAADASSAQSAGSADTPEPLHGTSWNDTSDSTGTVSPSPVPGAPAGFLMSRGHTLRLVAQRVALPGDPAVVVRYTADDPSFSPD